MKWKGNTRTERAASQEHFIDLCQMFEVPTPNEDPTGEKYAFEKGAEKLDGKNGYADVWLVGDTVQITQDDRVLGTHRARHDRTKEFGALANPTGRPRRTRDVA